MTGLPTITSGSIIILSISSIQITHFTYQYFVEICLLVIDEHMHCIMPRAPHKERAVSLWPCKSCGHNNPDDTIICENCGALMDEIGDSGDNEDSEDLFFDDEGI
jgi:hypothetical protein